MFVFCVLYCSCIYFQTKLFQERREILFLDLIWKAQTMLPFTSKFRDTEEKQYSNYPGLFLETACMYSDH